MIRDFGVKSGDWVVCKKNHQRSAGTNREIVVFFEENKKYQIWGIHNLENDSLIMVINNGSVHSFSFLGFMKDNSIFSEKFFDFFYTHQELRKAKLKNFK